MDTFDQEVMASSPAGPPSKPGRGAPAGKKGGSRGKGNVFGALWSLVRGGKKSNKTKLYHHKYDPHQSGGVIGHHTADGIAKPNRSSGTTNKTDRASDTENDDTDSTPLSQSSFFSGETAGTSSRNVSTSSSPVHGETNSPGRSAAPRQRALTAADLESVSGTRSSRDAARRQIANNRSGSTVLPSERGGDSSSPGTRGGESDREAEEDGGGSNGSSFGWGSTTGNDSRSSPPPPEYDFFCPTPPAPKATTPADVGFATVTAGRAGRGGGGRGGKNHILKRRTPGRTGSSRRPPTGAAAGENHSQQPGGGGVGTAAGGGVPAVSAAERGYHPSAADTAVLRAAGCGQGSPKERAMAGVPRKAKVAVHAMERKFIRSLSEIEGEVWEKNREPPLLGPVRPQRYGNVAGPLAGGRKGVTSESAATVVPLGPKKTLVLDLDETLVSSSRSPCDCDYKIVFKIHYRGAPSDDTYAANADAPDAAGNGDRKEGSDEDGGTIREIHYFVRLRPGLAKFLEKAAALYELVVWTASGQSYADAIIDLLDPTGDLFAKRLYRQSCVRHRGLCVKDLRRLGRPMTSVVLLDNYVYSFGFTLDNGVPISPWTGIEEAKESGLMVAYSLLKHVAHAPDVRAPLITAFDLHRRIHGKRSAPLRLASPSSAKPASTTTTTAASPRGASPVSRPSSPSPPTSPGPFSAAMPGSEPGSPAGCGLGWAYDADMAANAAAASAHAAVRAAAEAMAARSAGVVAAMRGCCNVEEEGRAGAVAGSGRNTMVSQ